MVHAAGMTVAALAFAPLCAQSPVTLPPGAATVEQNGRFNPGLLTSGPELHQILYGAAELRDVGVSTWRSIAFRPDRAGWPNARTVDVAIRLSSRGLAAPIDMLGRDPAQNRGVDDTLVRPTRTVNLPIVAASTGTAPQLEVVLPFGRPFAFAGGTGLLIELEWTGPTFDNTPLDALSIPRRPWSVDVTPNGSSCVAGADFSVTAGTGGVGQLVLTLQTYGPPASLGTAAAYALGPRTADVPLASVGAPGCSLLVAPAAVEPALSYPLSGTTIWYRSFSVGAEPTLLGRAVTAQTIVSDPSANALGITTSEGLTARVVAGPAAPRARMLIFPGFARGDAPLDDLMPVFTLR